jgi:hypothetical protein
MPPGSISRAATRPAPAATSASDATRTAGGAGGAATRAALKKGITAVIAVAAAPASARWTGSHQPPDAVAGSRAAAVAAARKATARTIPAAVIRRSALRSRRTARDRVSEPRRSIVNIATKSSGAAGPDGP